MNSSPPSENASTRISVAFIKQHALAMGVLCVLIIGGIATTAWSWHQTQSNHLLPGISISGIHVGGKTLKDATQTLITSLQQRYGNGWQVQFNERTIDLGTTEGLIVYEVDQTLQTAYEVGRHGSLAKRLLTPILIRLSGRNIPLKTQVNRSVLEKQVAIVLGDDLKPAHDAELVIQATATSSRVFVKPDTTGITIDFDRLSNDIQDRFQRGSTAPISLVIDPRPSTLTSADLQPLIPEAEAWLDKTPFNLRAEGKQWTLNRTNIAPWIKVNTSTKPLTISLDASIISSDLRTQAKDFLQPAHDGFIQVDASSTVVAFEAPVQGVDVDTTKTIENILTGWQNGSSTIDLVLTRVTPKILGDGERLGIQEVIGVGRSNFSGSPSNRRKNIALGAKKVNTTLIEPGSEFSMLKTLGSIDGTNGWLPELVIKGNKTLPEFGGGLCQVGTTMFRAALASGMPITERRNHSYRVRYYEPAGTDATIYEPAPDFKFKNDTTNWLLVTTSIKGDEMAFTIWGTNDGRISHQTTPRVYNIVAPPPKKIIETLDLPPGTEKCTESAHAGADAEFTYTVTYPNGTVKEETFKSHYRPWQAVCLKGVTALTQPTDPTVDQTGVNNPNL